MSSEKVWSGVNAASDQLIVLLCQRVALLERACSVQNDEILQTLGKALGYPWYRDDQKNFPGATEENGVCTGEHVAESISESAAKRITTLEGERSELLGVCRDYVAIVDKYTSQASASWVEPWPESDLMLRMRALISKLEGPQGCS